jgi:methanogenic corrinoid protein MtbC1
VDALVEDGVRSNTLIMIGGPPTSKEFADEIGADLHAVSAQEAVALVRASLNRKRR